MYHYGPTADILDQIEEELYEEGQAALATRKKKMSKETTFKPIKNKLIANAGSFGQLAPRQSHNISRKSS